MEKTRVDFDTLLRLLLDVIPEDQVALRKELKETIEPWWNIAPELRMNDEYWHPIAVVLQSHDDESDVEWRVKVRNIYNTGGISSHATR